MLMEIGKRAREASYLLGKMGTAEKNKGLLAAAEAILDGSVEILKANRKDIEKAEAKGTLTVITPIGTQAPSQLLEIPVKEEQEETGE